MVRWCTTDSHPRALSTLTAGEATVQCTSDIECSTTCHLFRHTVATLMLERGADIRYVQEMLGHASIETTQFYTKVSIRQLKAIHTATHPAAKLQRSSGDDDKDSE